MTHIWCVCVILRLPLGGGLWASGSLISLSKEEGLEAMTLAWVRALPLNQQPSQLALVYKKTVMGADELLSSG